MLGASAQGQKVDLQHQQRGDIRASDEAATSTGPRKRKRSDDDEMPVARRTRAKLHASLKRT